MKNRYLRESAAYHVTLVQKSQIITCLGSRGTVFVVSETRMENTEEALLTAVTGVHISDRRCLCRHQWTLRNQRVRQLAQLGLATVAQLVSNPPLFSSPSPSLSKTTVRPSLSVTHSGSAFFCLGSSSAP